MKMIFLLASLVYSMTAVAQTKSVTEAPTEPAITAAGKPSGKLSEMKISKEGGNLLSADGKVELKIPAGALTKNTNISILPITNNAPNGISKAYRLEPSGIKFQQPVQLVFHYTNAESAEDMQLLMGIAMQDEKGQWYGLKNFELDTIAKTITGSISHFSDWATFEAFQIVPLSTKLKVNKSIQIGVHCIGPPTSEPDELSALDDGLLTQLVQPKYMSIEKWTVNGITNGNSTVGTTRAVDDLDVTYKAPSSVPDQNPVAVVAHLKNLNVTFNGKKFTDLRLVSNILIYDNAYEVKMVASLQGGGPETWGGKATYTDKGSFIVVLNKGKAEVGEIVNNLEIMDNNCEKDILNPETCTGLIHVTGVKAMRVIPAQPPGKPYPTIEIIFIQRPIELTKFKLLCPPPPGVDSYSTSDGRLIAMATLLDVRTPGFPVHIKFEAKPEEQVIFRKGEEGSELFVKFTVKQIKDD